MAEETIIEAPYQVFVVNIKYGRKVTTKQINKPEMTILDIPKGMLKNMKNFEKFKDNVENFVYTTLTHKYGAEVNYCQIWLPLEEETVVAK